jgi:hypothetical protein
MLNPIAPPAVQGIDPVAPPGYIEVPFDYTYAISLTANQLKQGEVVSIFTEADFVWRGITFQSTGTFSVQFQDGEGYYLSSGLVLSTNMPNSAGDPWPRFPEIFYPAGGRIYLNIQDQSANTNTGQILFIGAHRYKVNPNQFFRP